MLVCCVGYLDNIRGGAWLYHAIRMLTWLLVVSCDNVCGEHAKSDRFPVLKV